MTFLKYSIRPSPALAALVALAGIILNGGICLGSDLLISSGPTDLPRVALTFDLCQKPGKPSGFDTSLVRTLEEMQVPATFFAGGLWMRSHPEETRRLASTPQFELASHSWSHPDLRRLDEGTIAKEVKSTEEELRRLTGRTTRLFRLPFGYYDEKVLHTLKKLGQRVIQWNLVTGDPDPKVSAADILEQIRTGVKNGSIIIMHANGRGRHTAEALPQIIGELRRRGFELVTVSTLLEQGQSPP